MSRHRPDAAHRANDGLSVWPQDYGIDPLDLRHCSPSRNICRRRVTASGIMLVMCEDGDDL